MLLIAEMIFEMTDRLSTTLQDSTLSACEGKKAAERVIQELNSNRSSEHFNKLWSSAEKLSRQLEAAPPCLPRKKSIPRRYDDGAPSHLFGTPKDYYCVIYFHVIDETVGAIERRFHVKGYEILCKAERVLVQSFVGDTVAEDDLKSLCEHFKDDLDFRRLPAQLQVVGNIESNLRLSKPWSITSLQQVLEKIRSIGVGERGLIPDVMTLLKLCLVLPASTASAERAFSTLRRIKTYLRSTMSQERLNHLMILNTYKELIDKLDFDVLVEHFVSRNDMRRRTFACPRR
jgi:hypothetical protein